MYVRFQATTPNRRGTFPGVFALVNGLAAEGRLTSEQESFRRSSYDWYDANLANPSHVDPAVYDRELNPGAEAWFKVSAHRHVEQVDGHLEILAAHRVGCETLRSPDPGEVVYEDEHQVVVVPYGRRAEQHAAAPATSAAAPSATATAPPGPSHPGPSRPGGDRPAGEK
ncbi:hypothetical protein [Kitasatospora sp. NPDC057198]|uniref:hypothetical protein n=1 Tax=Kitasatospora sp. NPDC057198 TaxID=3346046 RepID=UPI00363B757A